MNHMIVNACVPSYMQIQLSTMDHGSKLLAGSIAWVRMSGRGARSAGPTGGSGVVVGTGVPILAGRGEAPFLIIAAAYLLATEPGGRVVGLAHKETRGVRVGVDAVVLA